MSDGAAPPPAPRCPNDNNNKTPPCRPQNGSLLRSGPSSSCMAAAAATSPARPVTLPAPDRHHHQHHQLIRIVIDRDETGYGMKVSGDNPVYVQSVKDGGPAEKAGLHAGDKIIKVNGINVTQSTHTEVVALIKSSPQVALTVQQRNVPLVSSRPVGSPGLHSRPMATHASQRITGPQPVTHEKQCQLQLEREQQIRLMIEKEQRYIDQLRSEIAISPNDKKNEKLVTAESNLKKLHTILHVGHLQGTGGGGTANLETPPSHTHHRTKSSPESLCIMSPADASRHLIVSESLSDLSRSVTHHWERSPTPPGTPPPPYPSPLSSRRTNVDDGVELNCFVGIDGSFEPSAVSSPMTTRIFTNSSPIHAAMSQTAQQPIISMEDDEISDLEVGQLEDHGPFKSLSRLWEHTPHLAVFTNYILSNSDPNSLLFYLITDLYKEGNAKEMRKWAYEIHSSFLVPGAPLPLSNVDENIAREIDEVLTKEFDKEEILRKIFWKARSKANKELTRQLEDFQQKRTAGLGTIFGPNDAVLSETAQDKAKEINLYETLLLNKLEPYIKELEQENYDHKKYLMAAALTTIITRVFGIRSTVHGLDRCPTFVKKETFRPKFIGRYSKKLALQGHQFVVQPYYTVIRCNHCQQIINGIAPQGYQCSACLINLHRLCVKLYDDTCPGPIIKKDRGIGKFMDRIQSRDHRRKPSSHFIQMEKERRLAEERDVNTTDLDGDAKPGHPVSRSGSDRRPDALREESTPGPGGGGSAGSGGGNGGALQELGGPGGLADNHPEHDTDGTQDNTVSLPAYTGNNKKRVSTNINRSESVKEQSEKRKQRRNISDPLHNTTRGAVDLDQPQHTLTYQTNSGNSSNSSISSRSSDSPSTSLDAVSNFSSAQQAASAAFDSDMEVEADPPDWQSSVPPEELLGMHPHEKKRQDVINELFHTERSHVRNLRVLDYVFRKPLQSSKLLKLEDLNLIFPNLCDLLDVHTRLNSAMKTKRKENPVVGDIGELLLNLFDGSVGESFQSLAASFCERQQLALEFIKERRKKDSRFDSLLSECEKSNLCRRLPLQGILPTEMQRLSKYPLLLERLIECEEKIDRDCESSEITRLRQAHDRSKEILNFVNEAAKIAINKARLEDIQKHLDTSLFEKIDHTIVNEYKNIDFTKYNLIHEGTMHLRRPNKQLVALHVVLLEEAVILLQKDAERYVLKFFQAGTSNQQPLAPIIKTSTLLVRTNAASKSSLFLVNTSTQNVQIVDLLARDSSERDIWYNHISSAAQAYNVREGKSKRSEPAASEEEEETVTETLHDISNSARDVNERRTDNETEMGKGGTPLDASQSEQQEDSTTVQSNEKSSPNEISSTGGVGGGLTIRLTADEWPLVQPTEVQVTVVSPVHTAEPVLTPIEQIRRKGEEVRRALADKEGLVADLLSIPRDEYQTIADMVSSEAPASQNASELVLAAVFQADKLLAMVNDSLNVSDSEAVFATGGKHPACASNESRRSGTTTVSPSTVSIRKIRDIATTLSSQLTNLLSKLKQADEERETLRKELQKTREQLHEKSLLHGSMPTAEDDVISELDDLDNKQENRND